MFQGEKVLEMQAKPSGEKRTVCSIIIQDGFNISIID